MDVVWHDDEIGQIIALAVEMLQAVSNDLRMLWLTQHTSAMALVQPVVPTIRELDLKFPKQSGTKRLQKLAQV